MGGAPTWSCSTTPTVQWSILLAVLLRNRSSARRLTLAMLAAVAARVVLLTAGNSLYQLLEKVLNHLNTRSYLTSVKRKALRFHEVCPSSPRRSPSTPRLERMPSISEDDQCELTPALLR